MVRMQLETETATVNVVTQVPTRTGLFQCGFKTFVSLKISP
jgi:hypothetical protein